MGKKVIRFLETQLFESQGRGKGPVFQAGKEYTLDGPFADRWIKRKVAELVRELPDPPFNAAGAQQLVRDAQGLIDKLRTARLDLIAAMSPKE